MSDLASGSGIALVVLLRHHYCPLSRRKVRQIEARIEEFEAAHVTVAAVLPDTVERAAVWQRRYDVSFPLLADPGEDSDENQSSSFGAFETVREWMPQTPGVAVVDTRGEEPTIRQIHSGSRPQDCPDVGEMLDIAAEARQDPPEASRPAAD